MKKAAGNLQNCRRGRTAGLWYFRPDFGLFEVCKEEIR